MSLPQTTGSGLHTQFVAKLSLVHTCSHAGLHHFHPASRSHGFAFSQSYSSDPRSWSSSPSATLGASLIFEPKFLPVWQMALPSLVPAPHQVPSYVRGPHSNLPVDKSLLSIGAWQDHFSQQSRGHLSNKGGEKPPSPKFWTRAPKNVARISNRDMGHQGRSAGSDILLCQHRLSRLESKVSAPRTKGSHLIFPGKQVTEAKWKV
jgi:hypothetical protein